MYADGSRLYAEHKYCNLIARQGWAFAILDVDGVIIASAHGRTPWWASSIYAAELWALLNASLNAFPGSPLLIDCQAVQVGSRNGTAWMTAPSRRFGRAWVPLSRALEDDQNAVTWMPAHCTNSAVGMSHFSYGYCG